MSLVKLKTNGQVTLPASVRERAGLDVGDLLEVKLEKGKITLTPKSLLDQRLDEGLEDIRKGRTYGPFDSAEEMIASLRRNMKTRAKAKAKRSRLSSTMPSASSSHLRTLPKMSSSRSTSSRACY